MKIGVIGAGIISEIYLKNMIERFDDLEVLAVAARRLESARKRAAQFGLRACTVEELLADPEIEMVVNLTPVGSHYEIVKKALLAGKHVYTEKTIADDAEKARELLALADEKGLYLGAAPDTFLGAALQTARAAIDGGLLGEIHSFAISATRSNDLLVSLFPILRLPGAGILHDYGVYYLTALVSLLGPVRRVGGVIGLPYPTHPCILPGPDFGRPLASPNESQASAVIQLESGVTGTLHIDAETVAFDEAFFAVYGTGGVLYLTDPNQFGGQVKFLPKRMDWQRGEAVTLRNFSPYADNSRGVGPAEMAKAIAEGRPMRASKEMATHVLEVLDAILAGGEDGRFVDVRSTCVRPEALAPKKPPVTDIGHITFQMRNEPEMLRFYTQTLGMRPLFRLTAGDLAATLRAQNGGVLPKGAESILSGGEDAPWIQYLKLSDHQFLELFHRVGDPLPTLDEASTAAGFQSVAYETEDPEALAARLQAAGVPLREPLHDGPDGSLVFSVLDPDGNEIRFLRYGGQTRLPLTAPDPHPPCSPFLFSSQIAYRVRDGVNMRNFYVRGLGLRPVLSLSRGELADRLAREGAADEQLLHSLRLTASLPWAEYFEVSPHQYLQFLYTPAPAADAAVNGEGRFGYQHLCLEVSDIFAAKEAVLYNGIRPDTEITLGVEGAYQLWLTDPDGNRIELMAYSPEARQLMP